MKKLLLLVYSYVCKKYYVTKKSTVDTFRPQNTYFRTTLLEKLIFNKKNEEASSISILLCTEQKLYYKKINCGHF